MRRTGPAHGFSTEACLVRRFAPHTRTATLLLSSLSTVHRQVVFGRPLLLFPSGAHVRAVTQSLSGCFLRMCPMKRHLLLLTSSLSLSTFALSSSSLLVTLSCHLIFNILLRQRFWNTLILFMLV